MPPFYDQKKDSLRLSVSDLLWRERLDEPRGAGVMDRSELGRMVHRRRVEEQASKHYDYEPEVPLELNLRIDNTNIYIRGRVDGVWKDNGNAIVEEIKSVIRFRDFHPLPSHILQCRLYSWLYSRIHGILVSGLLSLVDVTDWETHEIPVSPPDNEFEEEIISRIKDILQYCRNEAERLENRCNNADKIQWIYPKHRKGQKEIEKVVGKALETNRHLLLEAPTGSGKTAPILLTTFRWCVKNKCRLAFATSRTAQQKERVQFIEEAVPPEARGRVLLLAAADKLCNNPDCNHTKRLHIPFSVNPYKPPSWFEKILDGESVVTSNRIRNYAKHRNICPRELQYELIRYADILIGDQNLLADPAYHPPGWFLESSYRKETILLIDEAHGLPDRVRDKRATILNLKNLVSFIDELVLSGNRFLQESASYLNELVERIDNRLELSSENSDSVYEKIDPGDMDFRDPITAATMNLAMVDYEHVSSLFQQQCEYLFKAAYAVNNPNGFVAFLDKQNAAVAWELVNPGRLLSERASICKNIIAFSATLSPLTITMKSLGMPRENTDKLQLFDSVSQDQRLILRYTGFSTAYNQRMGKLNELSEVLTACISRASGNWIVFFPSYTYLETTAVQMQIHGKIPVIQHKRGIPAGTVEKMIEKSGDPALHFMVLGGALAEGIGFQGKNIIGVAVISPGLPPVSPRRELIRESLDDEGEDGYLQAYVQPGLVRVVQACGRLIREENQRGIVLLIGERFARHDIAELLPESWQESPIVESIPNLEEHISIWLDK
ncbi:MAG: helicase C-terminal domain-containing protein [Candidatus Electryonea clarkiae]|nr:helicase C-terminal domain-containing protein [Candidatus Electryonea clarkiae]MDP8288861.1 helicase C-terminal domain-containing protein [Candidatus Electryonea clarkiae]